MPPTNLIVNGDFDGGNTGWSGNDLETNYSENAYLGNGSNNSVAEMDGRSGQTTMMEQSFTVANPLATELTLDSVLRTASNGQAGSEGFTAEIVDSNGNVLSTLNVLPTANTFTTFTLPVTFPAAGTYTVRLTELGPDNSLGAIVDNIELMVCFAGPTRISSPTGPVQAHAIQIGDMIDTETGPQPVCWVGKRSLTANDIAAHPQLSPVKITAGALGCGLPTHDLWVSRQHCMMVRNPLTERMFGQSEILIAAIRLTALPGIYVDDTVTEIDYVHILFDDHKIVFAEGTPSESLLLGDHAISALSQEAIVELSLIFPDLPTAQTPPARFIPTQKQQVTLSKRMAKNGKSALT